MVKFLEVRAIEIENGEEEILTCVMEPINDKTDAEIDGLPIKVVDLAYDAGLLDLGTRITPQLFSAP